jgi:hypothetical protein
VPVVGRGESGRELRNIQGFREGSGLEKDAGKMGPAWDAGIAPHKMLDASPSFI